MRLQVHFWDQHKAITRYYEFLMSYVCEKYRLRQMEFDILMFLHNNPEFNTAADIVKARKSTKSHVSTSLQTLEDRRLIERIVDDDNKRRVEIRLLPSADSIIADGKKAQKQFRDDVLDGMSLEEMKACKEIFDKICANAERAINKKGSI